MRVLRQVGKMSVSQIGEMVGVSRSVFYHCIMSLHVIASMKKHSMYSIIKEQVSTDVCPKLMDK